MGVTAFDHAAIPIEHVEAMLSFYGRLGFGVTNRGGPAYSVHFGDQKINFHGPERWGSRSFTLRGPTAVPGCGDFCFVWEGSEDSLLETLSKAEARVITGPVQRTGGRDGGRTRGTSFYIRDPDLNLLEFILYT